MIKFGLVGRDKLVEEVPPDPPPEPPPDPPPEPPPETDMPTLVTSREGECCDAVFYGDIIEILPRLYTSGGYTDKWWLFNCGIRNLEVGMDYEVIMPTTDCQWGGTQAGRSHAMMSHDGLDPNDPNKVWTPNFDGRTASGYRRWPVTAQSTTLDIANGLPATWTLLDQRLFDDWLPNCYDTDASVDTGFEIARTPPDVDQHGLQIPEQIQRMWHMGNPSGLDLFFFTGTHSPEMIGSRAWMHGVDLLLAEYPDILEAFRLTCTHTICPGRHRGHQRGLAVDAGSADPNRVWGQYNATTPFVSAIDDALRVVGGGQASCRMLIDSHSTFRGPAEIRYERNFETSAAFFSYIESESPGIWRGPVSVRARNSSQAAAVQQWGAQVGITLEWGDNEGFTDDEFIRDMRALWDGTRAALSDGFFNAGVVNGWEPPSASLVFDNQDANVERVGTWRESGAQGEYAGSSEFCGTAGEACDGYFQWDVEGEGEHHVEIWFTWHKNRTDQAIYEIWHGGGMDTVQLDQSNRDNASQWYRLGTYTDVAAVRVRSDVGQVSADAVRLVPTSNDPPPCECSDLVDEVDQLIVQAQALLQETSSPIAQDMLDTLEGVRAQIGG